jgi:peptidoglycan/LPS O-acetylase OafA/YrhL
MTYHFSQCRLLESVNLAVDLFFMLSGFVIAHSYADRLARGMSFLDYLARRAIRLYPMFLFGLVIGTLVLVFQSQLGRANMPPLVIAFSFRENLFYIPSFHNFEIRSFGDPEAIAGEIFPGNPPSWSLFFEVVASISFLVLFRLQTKSLAAAAALFFAGALVTAYAPSLLLHEKTIDFFGGWGRDNFIGGFPRVFYAFTMGLLLHSLSTTGRVPPFAATLTGWFKRPSLLYLLLLVIFAFPFSVKGLYPVIILAVVAPCIIYIGSMVTCTTALSLNTARFLGWISYPVYCLHCPIGRAVYLGADFAHLSHAIAFVVAVTLSLLISVVVTKLYDEPIRRRLSQWMRGPAKISPS